MIGKVISLFEKEAFNYLKKNGITQMKSRSERYDDFSKNSIFNQNESKIDIFHNNHNKVIGIHGMTIHHNKKLITDGGVYILKEYRNLKLYNYFSEYMVNKYNKYNYDFLMHTSNIKIYNKLIKKYNYNEVSINDLPKEYFKLKPPKNVKILLKKNI